MFAGVKALTTDTGKLGDARKMEEDGATAEEIWKATGWVRGRDGLWRWEIDDSEASIIETPEIEEKRINRDMAYVCEILKHDVLFKAYPQLRAVRLMAVHELENALAQANTSVITMSEAALDEKNILGTLLHEVQHEVQFVEKFANGSSEDAWKILRTKPGQQMLKSDKAMYKHTAGEAEARATAERKKLSAEERRETFPTYINEENDYCVQDTANMDAPLYIARTAILVDGGRRSKK